MSEFYGESTTDESQYQKRMSASFVVIGLILLGLGIQIVNWNQYFLSIIPLKISQTVGSASPRELRQIASICERRMKYSCAETALNSALNRDPSADEYLKLGELQRKTKSPQEAISSYGQALVILQKDNAPDQTKLSDTYYGLARSYESLGQNQSAINNYDLAIKAKPSVIQVTVTNSYLSLLKSMGKSDLAKAVVKEAQNRGQSSNLFSNAL